MNCENVHGSMYLMEEAELVKINRSLPGPSSSLKQYTGGRFPRAPGTNLFAADD